MRKAAVYLHQHKSLMGWELIMVTDIYTPTSMAGGDSVCEQD